MDAHGTFGCSVKATEQPAININHIVRGRGSHVAGPVAMVAQAAGVSLLNPHAILETVGVLGVAIAVQNAGSRTEFAAGLIGASWVWYLMVGLGATILQRWLTGTAKLWIQRVSGVVMLALAGLLALELM